MVLGKSVRRDVSFFSERGDGSRSKEEVSGFFFLSGQCTGDKTEQIGLKGESGTFAGHVRGFAGRHGVKFFAFRFRSSSRLRA